MSKRPIVIRTRRIMIDHRKKLMAKMGTNSVREFHDFLEKVIASKYSSVPMPDKMAKETKILIGHIALDKVLRETSAKTGLTISQLYLQTMFDLLLSDS